jgi:parallel beta-helix repeat protein
LGKEKNRLEKKTVTGILLALLIFSILAANMIVVAAQEKHDVAVVNVTPSATLVEKGNLVNISVVVENQGDFTETFTLNCTYDENLIEPVHVWGENVTPYNVTYGSKNRTLTLHNVTLASGVSQNVTFNWNTTEFWYYTPVSSPPYPITFPQKIAATASTVSGETDTEDNSLVSSSRVRVFVSPYVGIVPHTTVNSNLTIGTNYTVSIYTDYNGSDITGYQFTLSYDPNILNGVEVTNGDLIVGGSAMFLPGTFDNTAGELSITGAFFFMAGEVVPGPGILANVTFTVVGLGDSAITLGQGTQLKGWNATEEKTYDIVSDLKPDLFHLLHGFFQNAVVTHDVAVVSVTPYPTIVIEGENVKITVVIENQGTVAEDVTVKVYYDYDSAVSVPIETKTVSGLAVNTSRSINFTWNTDHRLNKTYTITGLVDELLGETDTDDNTLRSDERVTVLLDAVYIRPNGSIDPPITPISTVDNVTYTLTGNISASIVVERDSIVVDGTGYSVQGGGGTGIYLYGRNNVTIKSMEIIAFSNGIILKNSSNNSVYGNNITNRMIGILIFQSNNNSICGNNITNNPFVGIEALWSSYNVISGNNITNNGNGITLSSSSNTIFGNNISANYNRGILVAADNNSISGNNIMNNGEYGIHFLRSFSNRIYHNNFIHNLQQVYHEPRWDPSMPPSVNIWDSGGEGNFWSDFEERYPDAEELDGSGIWDTPYVIDENNQDNYPFVEPWSPKSPSPVETTQELVETIKDWNLSKGAENSLTSKLDNVIHQLNKENTKVATHKLTVFISQVEVLQGKKLSTEQADYLIAEAQRIIDLIEG